MTETHSLRRDQSDEGRVIELSRNHVWPLAIIIGLLVVVAVNAAFIYIAVSGADEVVSSYEAQRR